MRAAALLARFGAVPDDKRGYGYRAPCSVHERGAGHAPSLIIDIKQGGRVLVRCESRACDAADIVAKVGLSMADLRTVTGLDDVDSTEAPQRAPASTGARGTAAAESYRLAVELDAELSAHPDGDAAAMLRERFGIDPADVDADALGIGWDAEQRRLTVTARDADGAFSFRQGRAVEADTEPRWLGLRNPDDGTRWGAAGYIGRTDAARDVIVTEGPSDALTVAALERFDVVAIRGATAAARIDEIADSLRGRNVTIAADADDAGARFAAGVAEALADVANVRIAALPNGQDVGDLRSSDPARFGERFAALVSSAAPFTRDAQTGDGGSSDKPKRFGAADVIRYAQARYTLAQSTDGEAIVMPSDPTAPRVARSVSAIRNDLTRGIWDDIGVAPSRESIGTALATLEGIASGEDVVPVHLRAASHGGRVTLDLGDKFGRTAVVTRDGWQVIDPRDGETVDGRPIFKRTNATSKLPTPERGGNRDELRELLGFAANDPRWRLSWGWLVASVFADMPRPIFWALGPQGSGKSTRARMLLNIVDPADALGHPPGKNERDDTTAAAGRYLPTWDNIGTVSAATSDWLCRLVTGVEIGRRALYSDDDLKVTTIRRSGVATSIVLPFGLGPDALERLVLLELDRVPESARSSEGMLWEAHTAAHGRILGALLDDVAGVLANLQRAHETAQNLPRMADYATVLHALDLHAGTGGASGHAATYAASVQGVLAERAIEDPLTAALVKLARNNGGTWRGPAAKLYARIDPDRPDDSRAPWPTTPTVLSKSIKHHSETLRAVGLVAYPDKANGVRVVVLELGGEQVREADDGDDSSAWPTVPDTVPDSMSEAIGPPR